MTRQSSLMSPCECRKLNSEEFSESPGAGIRRGIGWKESVLNSATCVRELQRGAMPPHQIFCLWILVCAAR